MSPIAPQAPLAVADDFMPPADRLESELLGYDQLECPLEHFFAPGVYVRQITMPAGAVIVGHRHLTEHVNNVLTGRALVSQNGETKEMAGPYTFVSKPGVRKALLIVETMVWQTIHIIDLENAPESEEDKLRLVDDLEPRIIEKSDAWIEHNKSLIEGDVERLLEISRQ